MKMKKSIVFFRSLLLLSLLTLVGAGAAWAAKVENPASPEVPARVMPASLLVIGTYDDQDRANFGLFDRGGIATSAPQTHIVVAMRKTSYTHKNLLERKAATINIPSVAQLAEADLFGCLSGMKDGKFTDKLSMTKLTADKGQAVAAPMLREFPISLECELVECDSLDPDSPFDLIVLKVVKTWVDEGYANEKPSVNPKPAGLPEIALYIPGRSEGNTGYFGLGDYLGDGHSAGKTYMEKLAAPKP